MLGISSCSRALLRWSWKGYICGQCPTRSSSRHLHELVAHRLKLFTSWQSQQQQQQRQRARADGQVSLMMNDSSITLAAESSAHDVGRQLGLEQPVLSRVDDQSWDITRSLPAGCRLQLLDAEQAWLMAKKVFLHSAAHVLGAAFERIYGDRVQLADGPALQESGSVSAAYAYENNGRCKPVSPLCPYLPPLLFSALVKQGVFLRGHCAGCRWSTHNANAQGCAGARGRGSGKNWTIFLLVVASIRYPRLTKRLGTGNLQTKPPVRAFRGDPGTRFELLANFCLGRTTRQL